jgi:hypothetical protein
VASAILAKKFDKVCWFKHLCYGSWEPNENAEEVFKKMGKAMVEKRVKAYCPTTQLLATKC